MSYSFDGKVANQKASLKINGDTICSCCRKQVENPTDGKLEIGWNDYIVESYIHTPYYIYETKSGRAVVYCSDYCRKKHNHRFTRKKDISAEYEQKLQSRICKLENHIRKNLRIGDDVLDTLTGKKAKIVQVLGSDWEEDLRVRWHGCCYILDVDENVRYGWEIELVIE